MDEQSEIEKVIKAFSDAGVPLTEGDAEIFLGYFNAPGCDSDKSLAALKKMAENMRKEE